jgi:hypothetical protein
MRLKLQSTPIYRAHVLVCYENGDELCRLMFDPLDEMSISTAYVRANQIIENWNRDYPKKEQKK